MTAGQDEARAQARETALSIALKIGGRECMAGNANLIEVALSEARDQGAREAVDAVVAAVQARGWCQDTLEKHIRSVLPERYLTQGEQEIFHKALLASTTLKHPGFRAESAGRIGAEALERAVEAAQEAAFETSDVIALAVIRALGLMVEGGAE